jgi:flotillin
MISLIAVLFLVAVIVAALVISSIFRVVVPSNEVHIVQSSSKSTSYGSNQPKGNTYYNWPSRVPIIGVSKTSLPVSIFDVDLKDYEAFDKGRLPFNVDVKAFFRVSDSSAASTRVASFRELCDQLNAVVQGSIRSILAKSEIEEILEGRSTFGDAFTKEVQEQISSWGVVTVKNIELMDIRDTKTSKSISFIMEKKKSLIETQSRVEVAENQKNAKISEIEAQKETDIKNQDAQKIMGLKKVETATAVFFAQEEASQRLKEQEKITKEKEMAVLRVADVQKEEISKEVATVAADKDKMKMERNSEALLVAKLNEAKGIAAKGKAEAEALQANQLAPVQAQITLAKEIGENAPYQSYMLNIRKIEATEKIGVEQARYLERADVKIVCSTVGDGIRSLNGALSGQGGSSLGQMLETLAEHPVAAKIIDKITKD